MANTIIRLGYISVSAGGGGVQSYSSLASFPAIGQSGILYLALDTGKLYTWNGSAYIEASPSSVTSVNGQVGDVVLDKTSIGLDQVDNTSDADKPISDATQSALNNKVNVTGDTMNGQLRMLDTNILVDGSVTAGMPLTTTIEAGLIYTNSVNGVITSSAEISGQAIAINRTDANSTTFDRNITLNNAEGSYIISATINDFGNAVDATINFDDTAMHYEKIDNNTTTVGYGVFGAGVFDIQTTLSDNTYIDITGDSSGISMVSYDGVSTTTPLLPTAPEHVTVKKYVDDADILKENLANKSTNITLSENSDTLYPSQKAVKSYVDAIGNSVTANFEASTYYHELHVNYDFTGAISDGSPYKPFKTVQAAVDAAQLQNVGGNTAILIHLKKDITMVENIVVNNAVSNLYIMPAVRNNTSSAPFKIIGSLTISGSQTNRVRVQDIEFAPTSGYALVINDTNGRHLFQNCGFVNGSVAGLAGTGVNLTSTYRNFIEFVDCTIEGTMNIDGSPILGTTVTMYRCKLSYANVIVNSANIAVGMYDTYGIYGLTHTAGALAVTGMWGFAQTGFFNSTATLSGINYLSLANMSFQKPDLSFIAINKTGGCAYQLINVHRGETSDVLSGGRLVFGPTATDAGYKMGVSGNWPVAVQNVAGALDSLAANKIAITQKGAANGIAPLNSISKIDATYLPSYVDDVLEYTNLASFPVTGSTGIIYVALDTNKIYRWSGSAYIEISPSPALTWGSIIGTLSNQTDLQNALNSKYNNPTGTTTQYIRGDGSIVDFPTSINQANSLVTTVFNESGVTIPKMSVVYIAGGHGDMPVITLAQANSEATSSKTYGVVLADIASNQIGQVIAMGALTAVDTSQFDPIPYPHQINGTSLWLSPTTAGGMTTTKPTAPDHMVFIGTIVRTHPNQGVIEVKIQNGYELGELHNVQALNGSVSNNQVLKYDLSTNLWKNQYIGLASDIEQTLFSIINNQSSATNITGFTFSNTAVRSFEALVSIEIIATASLYETIKVSGIQKGSDWDITMVSSGDISGVTLSITSSGQIQYTSQNVSGFVSGILKFRAITTSV